MRRALEAVAAFTRTSAARCRVRNPCLHRVCQELENPQIVIHCYPPGGDSLKGTTEPVTRLSAKARVGDLRAISLYIDQVRLKMPQVGHSSGSYVKPR